MFHVTITVIYARDWSIKLRNRPVSNKFHAYFVFHSPAFRSKYIPPYCLTHLRFVYRIGATCKQPWPTYQRSQFATRGNHRGIPPTEFWHAKQIHPLYMYLFQNTNTRCQCLLRNIHTFVNKYGKIVKQDCQHIFEKIIIRGRGGISVKNTRLGDNIIFNRNWKIPKLHTNNL